MTRRDKIHEGVSKVLKENFKSVRRMTLDFRGSITRQAFGPFFEGVDGYNIFLFLNSFMFHIHFAQFWRNFLRCSRGVGIFPGFNGGVLELSRVLNTPWVLRLLFLGVKTVLLRGCH